MTTAIIGTGGIGSVIARQLASGGEILRLSSADTGSAQRLAAEIGRAAVAAAGNRDALLGAGAVVLALRFTLLKGVIEIAGSLADKVVVVPSNPLTTDAHGNVFYATDGDRAGEEVERLIRTAGFEPVKIGGIEQLGRLEVGGDLHDLVVGPAKARSLIGGA